MINYFEEEVALKRSKLKKDIKITAGKCTRMLLTLGIVTQVLAIIIMIIIKVNGNSIGADIKVSTGNGAELGLSKDLYDFLVGYIPCILGDIIAIILGLRITKVRIKSDIFCKNQSNGKFIALGAMACIGAGLVSNIIYTIYSSILEFAGITIPSPDFNFPTGNPIMLTLILGYVCVLGPILEEIIFRGLILKSMQRYGNLTAIIVTSILFSMFHLNLVQFVPPVLIGLILGFITIRSKSIVPSIIAHIFNNTLTFLISSIIPKEVLLQNIISIAYAFVAILGLVLFIRKYGEEIIRAIKEDTKLLKTRQKIAASFSGGWSIVYIIFYVGMVGGLMLLTNIS